jgi:hypothetical protein
MYHDPRLENRYHVWLLIADFECLPDEITQQVGLKPTKTRLKGEYRTVGKKKPVKLFNKENSWILEADLPSTVSVEEQIKEILKQLKPYAQNILSLSKKYSVELNCAIYYYEANPGINLDKNLLKEVSQLNLPLNFDVYCLAGTHSQFEYPEAEKELTKQFSKVAHISKFNSEKHDEAKLLASSLIKIDKAVHDLEMYMDDVVIWDGLTDEEHKIKFEKVNENLRSIVKEIRKSKYLSSETIDSKE